MPTRASVPKSQSPCVPRSINHPLTSDAGPLPPELRGLRVLFLAGTLGQGGAERQLFHTALAVKELGGTVRVLTLESGGIWQSRLQQMGITVTPITSPGSRFKRILRILREVVQWRPIILQSQHFFTNAYSGLSARMSGAYAIGAVRGNGRADLLDCGKTLAKTCLFLPHVLAVNSRSAIDYLQTQGVSKRRLHYLPNVIDTQKFRPPGVPKNGPLTILGIGRFGPEKRFDRFLRVVQQVHRSLATPLQVLLAGNGPLSDDLRNQAHRLGLFPGVIQFLGDVPNIGPIYHQADALLLTSDHEGTPNVIMEAMASGVCVVATRVGGVPELIQNGVTGFLVAPSDEVGLADSLAKVLQSSTLRTETAAHALSFIEQHHSLPSLSAHLNNLYQPVLSRLKGVPPLQQRS